MSSSNSIKPDLAVVNQTSDPVSDSASLFMDCFDKVYHKKVPNLNPNIFRVSGAPQAPENFKQLVPDMAYRKQKRTSVF